MFKKKVVFRRHLTPQTLITVVNPNKTQLVQNYFSNNQLLDNVNFIYPIFNPAFLTATNVRVKKESKISLDLSVFNLISVL